MLDGAGTLATSTGPAAPGDGGAAPGTGGGGSAGWPVAGGAGAGRGSNGGPDGARPMGEGVNAGGVDGDPAVVVPGAPKANGDRRLGDGVTTTGGPGADGRPVVEAATMLAGRGPTAAMSVRASRPAAGAAAEPAAAASAAVAPPSGRDRPALSVSGTSGFLPGRSGEAAATSACGCGEPVQSGQRSTPRPPPTTPAAAKAVPTAASAATAAATVPARLSDADPTPPRLARTLPFAGSFNARSIRVVVRTAR